MSQDQTGEKSPPTPEQVTDLKRLAAGIIRAQGNRFIKELLRARDIRIGVNKDDFERNLTDAIERGDLTLDDVDQWLKQVEGWGDQHVYLFNLSEGLRTDLTEQTVRRRVTDAGLEGFWNRPTVLAFSDAPELTSISFNDAVLRIVWQESSPGWTPVPEKDFTQDEGLDTFEYRAWRKVERRAITRFEAHLDKGLAALFIADPIQGEEHQQAVDEAWRVIDVLMDRQALRQGQVDISVVSRNLDQRNVPTNVVPNPTVKSQRSRLTSGGAYVEFAATSRDRAYWEEDAVRGVRQSVRGAQLQAFQGSGGVFIFQPGPGGANLTRSLRVQLYGKDERIRLWAQMDADEVWSILTTLSAYPGDVGAPAPAGADDEFQLRGAIRDSGDPKMAPDDTQESGPRRGTGAARRPEMAAPPAGAPPRRRRAHGGDRRGARPPARARTAAVVAAPERRPFAAWPDVVAPESVEEYHEFTLEIGFSRQRQPGVAGGPVVLVDAPPEFDLRVQVVGVGFDAPDGWAHDLHVVRDDPFSARLEVKLIAEALEERVETRTLAVQFYYESNLCGQAQRSIVVAKAGVSAGDRAATSATAPPAANVPVRVKTGLRAPDLTVTVRLVGGRGSRESFLWSFESPRSISIPDSPAITELDQGAGSFVDALLQELVDLSDGPTADNEMRGIARQIERKVPPTFWIALKEVANAIAGERRAPDVLFVTEETRLPWELAWMRKPLDPARPNHLGAQVNFGRWILGADRPPLPPEHQLPWHHMVVVVGNYPAASGLALPDAVAEAQTLASRATGRITPIELNGVELDPFLEGEAPPDGAEIVHFACHGKAQAGNAAASSLIMQNGKPFTPATLGGSEIGQLWKPFLFLNACEVGRAGVALGETAGFAGAALYEGFRAFVGPLWEVDSEIAREIAVEFYTRTLDQGEPIAAVLRDVRSKYLYRGANAAPSPDTYLAYVYYGHPALRFERQP